MNPFDLSKTFDAGFYHSLSKISKSSEKSILEGLKEMDLVDITSISNNILFRDSLQNHLVSSNTQIKNLSTDILLKVLTTDFNLEFWQDILSSWVIKFVNYNVYISDIKIFKLLIVKHQSNGSVLQLLEKDIRLKLDWENDTLTSFKVLSLLCKHLEIEKYEYKTYLTSKVLLVKYNSNLILKYLYNFMKLLGSIDLCYKSIEKISTSTLINLKWKILFEIYKKIPENLLIKDTKYIQSELLKEILEVYKGNLNNLEIKTFSNLKIIFEKVIDKTSFLKNNLEKVNLKDVCIYQIIDDLQILDKIFSFEFVNNLIINVITFHSLQKFFSKNGQNIKKLINEKNANILKKLNFENCKYNENTEKNINCCHKDSYNIFMNLILSLNNLTVEQQFIRANMLNVKFNTKSFDIQKVLENTEFTLNLFDKEVFIRNKSILPNPIPVICKYPENFEIEEVNSFINVENLVEISKIIKFKKLVKEFILTNYYPYTSELPDSYDLFIFYRYGNPNVRKINYKELLSEFLDTNFIIKCYKLECFDTIKFTNELINSISNIDIPVTTEYNNIFYSDIPHFYKEIKQKTKLAEIEKIANILEAKIKTNSEKLIYLICCEILNKQTDISIAEYVKMDIGKNNYFLYKVYKNLNFKVIEPFKRDKNFIANLPDSNYKKIDLKFREGLIDVYSINFTYLSTSNINIAVNRILENFDLNKSISLLENDKVFCSNFFMSERLQLYKPVINKIADCCSKILLNNFGFILAEKGDKSTKYSFLMSCFPIQENLFWILLTNTLMQIRNLNLIFFIESEIQKIEDLTFLFKNMPDEICMQFAFLFPNLFTKVQNKKVDLTYLLCTEASFPLENTICKIVKTSTGIQFNIKYEIEDNEYICNIKYPIEYPFKRPIFTTTVEKKSLINLKINEILSKTSKFMEVINLWKINIDHKSQGVSECYICYFVLNIVDGTFPQYICIHCNNAFHTKCIDKWMSGYKNSTCPLCRKPLPLF